MRGHHARSLVVVDWSGKKTFEELSLKGSSKKKLKCPVCFFELHTLGRLYLVSCSASGFRRASAKPNSSLYTKAPLYTDRIFFILRYIIGNRCPNTVLWLMLCSLVLTCRVSFRLNCKGQWRPRTPSVYRITIWCSGETYCNEEAAQASQSRVIDTRVPSSLISPTEIDSGTICLKFP